MPRALPSNAAISRALRELALFLEMDGVLFKPQALERAAAWVAASPRPLAALYRAEGVRTLGDLERAVKEGRARTVARLGVKREARLLAAFQAAEGTVGRRLLGDVLPVATQLAERMRQVPGVQAAEAAGSVRRFKETIGDIDLVVASTAPRVRGARLLRGAGWPGAPRRRSSVRSGSRGFPRSCARRRGR